jgi:TRAP-type C4-dicarboxylate transport system permease small subunit
MLMVLVIFAGLPLVSLRGEHVVFDSLDPLLERWVRRAQGLVVELLCAAALAGVAWLMWVKAGNMMDYGDTSAQLKIPQGPFVYVMSVLCALTALVHLLLIVAPTTHHYPGIDEVGGAL